VMLTREERNYERRCFRIITMAVSDRTGAECLRRWVVAGLEPHIVHNLSESM
jgi:hypothetical protein